MVSKAKITVLVDNIAGLPDLVGEHGLSFLVETPDSRVLFDVGQGSALAHNVGALSISIADVDAVVLSHGHYDHSGGLSFVLNQVPEVAVFLHPDATGPKFTRSNDGEARYIGIPKEAVKAILGRPPLGKVVWTNRATQIAAAIWATGEIPRICEFEDASECFFTDAECTMRDSLPDDQALFVETSDGVVVLLGCAHSGLVNTLRHVGELRGDSRIHAVLGGTHLGGADDERVEKTAQAVKDFGVRVFGPAHCTGERAVELFKKALPEQVVECSGGSVFEFG